MKFEVRNITDTTLKPHAIRFSYTKADGSVVTEKVNPGKSVKVTAKSIPHKVKGLASKGYLKVLQDGVELSLPQPQGRKVSKVPPKVYPRLHSLSDANAMVAIPSYNPDGNLELLVSELSSIGNISKILIIDDASDTPIDIDGAEVMRNGENYGKEGYWKTITKAFMAFRDSGDDILLQLDDDFMLCDDFMGRACHEWRRNHNPVAMKLHRDNRWDRRIWGMPRWLDGGSLYSRNALSYLGYAIQPISRGRWERNPLSSSGVWRQVSSRLGRKFGYGSIAYPSKSLLFHMRGDDSMMNKAARNKMHIETIRFYGRKDKYHIHGTP